jgi:hypothetical protein
MTQLPEAMNYLGREGEMRFPWIEFNSDPLVATSNEFSYKIPSEPLLKIPSSNTNSRI